MGIFLASRKYQTQTRGNVDLDFLSGVIGEKIKVITEVYFDQVAIATSDTRIIYFPNPALTGRVYNNDLIYFEDGNFLNQCQVGDTILFHHNDLSFETYELLEIISGGVGRFDCNYTVEAVFGLAANEYAANITPLKSLIYQFGLGTGGFNSQTDDSLQKFIINSTNQLDTVTVTLENIGDLDWQFDTVTSEGEDSSIYVTQQRLTITHETIVSPLFLAGQYDDLFLRIAPVYFQPDNKIKYSSQIDYQKSAYTPNEASSLIPEDTGQFAWFNTKFDGGQSDYSISDLEFERLDSSIASQLEYAVTKVTFKINSVAGNFDEDDSVLVFGFNYLPSNESFYQNTNRTIERNFVFDSKRLVADNAIVVGDKYGASDQVIQDIKAEVLNSNECLVTVNIEIATGNYTILQQGDIAQYALWCIVENIGLNPELSDKSNLLVDVNYIYVQKTKIDLLDSNTLFIEHPYDTLQYAMNELTMFPVDDVVANSLITLDYTDLEDDGILLKSVRPQILLKKTGEADIILDSEFISLENYPLIGDLPAVQDIKFQKNRPYKIEDGIRKTITMYRNYSLDSGNSKAWLLSFPFMNRWEYWIRNLNLQNIPSDLFDNTVPFGGANHLWNRIVNISDWELVYRTTFEIIQNGENFEQSFDKVLLSTDFNSNTEWSDCLITSHDLDTDDEIIVGPKRYVYDSKNTLIRAVFTKSTGTVPDLENVYMVIWAEAFEGGGITEIKNIDSGRDVISSSPFTGINGTKRVSITKNINTFTGEAVLDFTKLPVGQKITVYARIYEIQSGDPEDGRVTNEDILRMTLDGQIRLVN